MAIGKAAGEERKEGPDGMVTDGRDDDADAVEPGLINCLMLVSWPARRAMVQHAVLSFAAQDYKARALTIVNDGSPCHLSSAFSASCRRCRRPHRSALSVSAWAPSTLLSLALASVLKALASGA